ncbi:hypothetical protein [Streptomyces lunalinharesii]|uniref:Uncharacterized protein n=1 Tax=Streptomyces lunalinharesii TaxID=333384 RepID=A0ABP6ERS0_9ACTN
MPLRVAVTDLDALRERCDTAVVRAVRNTSEFEDGAIIPSGAWKPLTAAAGRALAAPPHTSPATLVEVVKLPAPTGADLEGLAKPLGDEQAQYLGQALAEPGMTTTTNNYQDGRLIGLHLDNWDKLGYAGRPGARRRLALNLGPGNRYIILGALDAQAVCRAVHPRNYARRSPHTDDYRAYVAAGHRLACIRVRISPGEGYLAPTEYLLHDGSTQGVNLPSAIAFWLGRWPRGTLPPAI